MSFIFKPTKFTISIMTRYKASFSFFWLMNFWYGWRFIDKIPFLLSSSLHNDMISAIGFCFSLAIEVASRIVSSSTWPSISFFFATSLGNYAYPKAQKMDSVKRSGDLNSFLRVWAFLQFAEISIISGLYSFILSFRS